jgi:hypothetical protein
MFCPQCGSNNDDQARHCSQCGTALQPVAVQAPPPQYPAPGAPPQYPPPAAPPYYPPPQFNAGVPPTLPSVPNYMTQAILVTLFCCIPVGIVAIIRANEVNKKLGAGDYAGAVQASNSAKSMCWWAVGAGIAFSILWTMHNLGKF